MIVLSVQNEETNSLSYFYVDEQTKHSILIEPCSDIKKYNDIINENDLILEKIIFVNNTVLQKELFENLNSNNGVQYYIYEKDKNTHKTLFNILTNDGNEIEINTDNYYNNEDEITISTQPETVLSVLNYQESKYIFLYDKLNKIAFCCSNEKPNEDLLPQDVKIYYTFCL